MTTPRLLVCRRGHSRDPNDPNAELRLARDGRYDCIPCKRERDKIRYRRNHPHATSPKKFRSDEVYEEWLALQPISRNTFAERMGMTRDALDKAISRATQRRGEGDRG